METIARFPIRLMVTHRDPDIDDVEAIRLLIKYGEKTWPGISTAKVLMSHDRDPFGKSADVLEKEGVLLVGIGGGRYDEHPFDGARRLENHCAATLVAQDLGLNEDHGLTPTLDYAFARNYSANSGHFELQVAIKLAFRYFAHNASRYMNEKMEGNILRDSFLFLDAIEADRRAELRGCQLSRNPQRTMDEITAKWLLRKLRPSQNISLDKYRMKAIKEDKSLSDVVARDMGVFEDPCYAWILDYARNHQLYFAKRLDIHDGCFNLAYLVEVAQKHLCTEGKERDGLEAVTRATSTMLSAMWAKDYNFHVECRKDFESDDTHVVERKVGGRLKTIVSVVSSNPEMQKYARSSRGGYAALVIKQEKNGRGVQIFFSKKDRIDPKPIIARIREAERRTRGIHTILPESHLQEEGNSVEGAEGWYFDGHQILNGSLTTKQPPSRLPRHEIERIVLRSLRLKPKVED